MKKKLVKLCTSFMPMLIFQNMFRFRFVSIGALFKGKGIKGSELRKQAKKADPDKQLCFLLGSPRSGTTLTSILLDQCQDICSPPELYLATFDDMEQRRDLMTKSFFRSLSLGLSQCIAKLSGRTLAESMAVVRALENEKFSIPDTYDYLISQSSEKVFIDKTPCYVTYIKDKLFTQRFPKAKYLYMHRHPISVILSQKKWMDDYSDKNIKKALQSTIKAYEQRKTNFFSMLLSNPDAYWEFEEFKSKAYPKCNFDKFKVLEAGWYYENKRTMEFLDTLDDDQKYIFSFESLLKNPEKELQSILDFLEIEADTKPMIEAYEARKSPDTVRGILKEAWHWEVGDPNQIFLAGKIDGSRADKSWQQNYHLWQELDEETREFVKSLGYEEYYEEPERKAS